ncbi:hypothetical protein BpHYR1_029755 [Brachionus plicatilis]|uniref:Uncharacterized protein n=1 Tax=Brachionus plicatilis TaxID=10195 RepID=A0A3M7PFJ0_BRAPC|nr:hypothetical protein BpHYR1_029755 [Brachionus plicatilis]
MNFLGLSNKKNAFQIHLHITQVNQSFSLTIFLYFFPNIFNFLRKITVFYFKPRQFQITSFQFHKIFFAT